MRVNLPALRSLLVPALVACALLPPAAAQASTTPDATYTAAASATYTAAAPAPGGDAAAHAVPATVLRALAVLDSSARVTGLAWAVADGRLTITADSTVGSTALARLQELVAEADGAVWLERVSGELRTLIAGGEPIYSSVGRCTLGANVRSGGTYYFVTAGHCAQPGSTWYAGGTGGTTLGVTTGSSFPSNDYAVVRYTNTTIPHPSSVYLHPGYRQILSTGNAYVGQAVCMSGATSGVRCGTVTALNATVNYAQGVVYGLIRTNICAEPGDSGAPLYAGTVLLGILSGGSGNCTVGGTSYFQPIAEILNAYGLTVP